MRRPADAGLAKGNDGLDFDLSSETCQPIRVDTNLEMQNPWGLGGAGGAGTPLRTIIYFVTRDY